MSIKIFHVKFIIYLKIFWTKIVNNIVLLNFITKNPLLFYYKNPIIGFQYQMLVTKI
jgi:hypothetical protein